jgi:hypothetical protein
VAVMGLSGAPGSTRHHTGSTPFIWLLGHFEPHSMDFGRSPMRTKI